MTLIGATRVTRIDARPDQVHLRLLATTDLHAHLLSYDYFTDRPASGFGLARLADLIEVARAGTPNTLLFDNGDTLEGTPLADATLAHLLPTGKPNPMITAMNALGYDAATVGNHDLDFGLDYLETSLADARFPVVLANARRQNGEALLAPRTMLERDVTDGQGRAHRLRIGVTGAVPPQVTQWSRLVLRDELVVSEILGAITSQAQALRDEGADLVVALSHSGLGRLDAPPGAENVSLQVAAFAGVDVVVAGHTHDLSAQCATPTSASIVQPAAYGTHLGLVDLVLDPVHKAERRWQVSAQSAATPALPVSVAVSANGAARQRRLFGPFPSLRTEVARAHRATRAHVGRPLGQTAVPLETLFSTLAPCAATQLVADAQRAAAAPLIASRPDLAGLRVLSAAAPFRAGGRSGPDSYTDIPAGDLKLRHAADLYIYPNALCLVRMTGAGVAEWLERAVSIYNRIDPGADGPQRLIDHGFAPYNFDRITGLRYVIDLTQPARTDADGVVIDPTANRIRDLTYVDNKPVGAEDEVLVITNSYRAAGGGHVPSVAESELVSCPGSSIRDAIAQYISSAGTPLVPRVEPTFTFAPLSGTPVIFETGRAALEHPQRLAELGLRPLEGLDGTKGFAPFLLEL